jgi:PKD repeat protein
VAGVSPTNITDCCKPFKIQTPHSPSVNYFYSTTQPFDPFLRVSRKIKPLMKKLVIIPFLLLTFGAAKAQNCYASFNYTQNGSVVSFLNQSSPVDSFTTFLWTFGDGDTSFLSNPVHSYNSTGMHLVCLTMETSTGCTATYCDSVFTDTIGTATCYAAFSYSQDGPEFQFQNNSISQSAAVYEWNFGDGSTSSAYEPNHNYSQAGYYIVCLTVTADDGCTNSSCTYVQVIDTSCSIFLLYYMNGTDVQFYAGNPGNGNGSYSWDFGDGQTSTQMSPFHSYDTPGYYYVCVQYNDSNCYAIDCDSFYVGSADSCAAGFYAWQTNADVQFTPYYYDPLKSYLWSFGDGTYSNEGYASHTYSEDGIYEVCLTVTGGGCNSTTCQSLYFTNDSLNNNNGACEADFQISGIDTASSTIWITDYSTGANTYLWDFGDGTTSTVQYPSHTYSQNGTYEVCLTIICDSNESSFHCEWIGIMDSLVSGDNEIRSGFTMNVIPGSITSVTPVNPSAAIAAFPNPTSGNMQLQLPADVHGSGILSLYDAPGRLALSQEIVVYGKELISIDLHGLAEGFYLLQLRINDQLFTTRLIKQ